MKVSETAASWALGALALVLLAVLLFFYGRTRDYDPTRYAETQAVLRQLKQADAEWELQVLRSRIGLSLDYDTLVDPWRVLRNNLESLDAGVAAVGLASQWNWPQLRVRLSDELRSKSRLIEKYKSHNAVLRNSVAYLPLAEDELQEHMSFPPGTPERDKLSTAILEVLLSALEYTQASSTSDKAAEVRRDMSILERVAVGQNEDFQARLAVFRLHVDTILREQPLITELIASIASTPVPARLDALIVTLTQAQLASATQDRHYHLVLLTLALVLAMLLTWLTWRLIRSYDVIQRFNRALHNANSQLEQRVSERTEELQRAQSTLMATARQAGMAEIATNVLHNVGNVLNSVNTSADSIGRHMRMSRGEGLVRAVEMLDAHRNDLGTFLHDNPKGRLLPEYLRQVSEAMSEERASILDELHSLTKSINHIKEIVSTQQSLAGLSTLTESIDPLELIEDALRMQSDAFARHRIEVIRQFETTGPRPLDRHRTLMILINLLGNARQAMTHTTGRPRRLAIAALLSDDDRLLISVTDNGEGIAPENLNLIFTHGFTTRPDGHGFGLHSCALAAMEMGASLTVHSDGPAQGASFVLVMPARPLARPV